MATMLDIEDIGPVLSCGSCNRPHQQLFRCTTCIKAINHCQICTIRIHQGMPFHRVVVWDSDSGCFRRTSLAKMGLILRIGHCNHVEVCPNLGTPNGVAILHTNGIHHLSVQFCYCTSAQTEDLQLFESRIFPATVCLPQTAFTFTVLEQFRHLHLEGKSSAHTFMNTLYRLTDDTGCVEIEVLVRIYYDLCTNLLPRIECGNSAEYSDNGTICKLGSCQVDMVITPNPCPSPLPVLHALIPERIFHIIGLRKYQWKNSIRLYFLR
jgi:hypothetical protein